MAINTVRFDSKDAIIGEPRELTPGSIIQAGTGTPLETFGLLDVKKKTIGGTYTFPESQFIVLGKVTYIPGQSLMGSKVSDHETACIPLVVVNTVTGQVGSRIQYMPLQENEMVRRESPRFTVTSVRIEDSQLVELQGQFGIVE